jgi:hypothetical protein
MQMLIILLTILLSCFSTAVMSYISMATPIGPWIAPTLVLIMSLFKPLLSRKIGVNSSIAYATVGGSVGGILATAFGFSFPTLYFLDAPYFNTLMASPAQFCFVLGLLAITAGMLGFAIADSLEQEFIRTQNMPFPIGQLIAKMIAAQNQARKALELGIGFCSTFIFTSLQGGYCKLPALIPSLVQLSAVRRVGFVVLPALQLRLDILPMLWAIGFIAGKMVAVPLLAGTLAKILIMDPLQYYYFPTITPSDFAMAFCSGMVSVGAVLSFFSLPKVIRSFMANYRASKKENFLHIKTTALERSLIFDLVAVLLMCCIFFYYFSFSLTQAIYLLIGTYISTYQICTIAGKIGLAQMGRFATFVMVPALLLFGIHPLHLTLISTFVEICGGVAVDVLFGRKLAQVGTYDRATVRLYQLLGLVISALTVGLIFWLLIHHWGLGGEKLVAQRSQSRALLINIRSFDLTVLALGSLLGIVLHLVHLNPMLVLGGLLMPFIYSLGLILGGLSTYVVKKPEEQEPFWSGVFAANSIVELLKTFC